MDTKSMGAELRKFRKAKGYSPSDVERHFLDIDPTINDRAVLRWERGDNKINGLQLVHLCQLYGITNPVEVFLGEEKPPLLNSEGQRILREMEDTMIRSGKYKPATIVKVYLVPAAAGPNGQVLDDGGYEEREIAGPVPAGTDYAVPVSGQSMLPKYEPGQLVFVQKTEQLTIGDIGIFAYQGVSYLKRLGKSGDGIQLESLNDAFAPIPIESPDELYVSGKVLN